MLCVIWAQLDGVVVKLTSYTEDSGNATPSVCHYAHNKINAAAVTNQSIHIEIRYKYSSDRIRRALNLHDRFHPSEIQSLI